jgi:H+-transporting ATPase
VSLLRLLVWFARHHLQAILLPVLAIIISAVPVALPMVLAVTLSAGAYKIAQEGAIVTNLGALQEMASMDLLCSDKTGTLTTAEMTVYPDKVWVSR